MHMSTTKQLATIKSRAKRPKAILTASRHGKRRLLAAVSRIKKSRLRVLTALENKEVDFEDLAGEFTKNPNRIDELFRGLSEQKPEFKYGCQKLLRILSEKWPSILYPHFNRFAAMLDSENTFIKWGAIIIIGNLAGADVQNKIDAILDQYLAPIKGAVMITAANVIGGAGRIARAKRRLSGKIARAILEVEGANYATQECRNVAIGHAINSLAQFYSWIPEQRMVVEFVRRQLANSRNATRLKAAKFLKENAPGAFAFSGASDLPGMARQV